MRCGAAARTRLATSPRNWRAPVVALAVVAAIALGVLAAAVVKLAGDSGSTASRTHTAVAGPSSVTAAGPASVTSPGTAKPASAPTATTPTAPVTHAAPAPTAPVTLIPVTTVAPTIVNLNGTVNPQGVRTTYQFEYGPTTKYGGLAPGTPISVGSGTAIVTVSARVAYLARRTTYHYRLIGSKAGHDLITGDATFTTR
jgi:hypothetical protein